MSRQPKVWNRKLNWLSSVDGDPKLLAELDRSMAAFYSEFPRRQKYQAVIDADSSAQPQTEGAMRTAILARQPATVLEVGCGSARIYQRLRAEGLQGAYTGLEMSPELIAQDQKAFPGASWCVARFTMLRCPLAPSMLFTLTLCWNTACIQSALLKEW